jgi:hypothetical protein
MRPFLSVAFAAVLTAASAGAMNAAAPTQEPTRPSAESLANLPVLFEQNKGQFRRGFDFGLRANGQTFLLSGTEASVDLDGSDGQSSVTMRLAGACDHVTLDTEQAVTRTNYFIGSDRSKWIVGLPNYRSVRYQNVYPGIDVEYHTRRGTLEYDFIVSPGANWQDIKLDFDGAETSIDASGNLVLRAGANEVRHRAPLVYQKHGSEQRQIESSYRLTDGQVTFVVGEFDHSLPLVIDPALEFARSFLTLLGAQPVAIDLDPAGNIVIAASVYGASLRSIDETLPGYPGRLTLVTKLDPR